MDKKSMSGLIVVLFLLFPFPVYADTYYVPDDFSTIQEALDGVVEGDTIIVRDGTYTGDDNKDLDFGGKALTLESENGPANCIIDCEDYGRAFTFDDGEHAGSIVDGFTIINGLATGSRPDNNGGGISCWTSSSPTITNCVISNNTASGAGGGIACYSSSPTITNCTISANSAHDGGGISCDDSEPLITNCILWGDSAYFGEEIYLANISSLTLSYSDVDGGRSAACVEIGSSLNWGVGNMDAEPLFVDELNADYRLEPCSPCIDVGDPASDFFSEPMPNGGIINMGAYGNTLDAAVTAEMREDFDGDGYSECQGDCDDNDADINPGAEEIPFDGIDQNCDASDEPDDDDDDEEDGGGSDGFHCFFSSSAYGSPIMDRLDLLREFRDRYLLPNLPGKMLVEFYYRVSPPLARFTGKRQRLRLATRAALIPTIWVCTILLKSPGAVLALTGVCAGSGLLVLAMLAYSGYTRRTPSGRKSKKCQGMSCSG